MYYLFKSPRYTDKLHIRYCMNLTEFKEKILSLLNESGRDWDVKSDDGFNIAVLTKNDGSFIIKLQNGSSMKRKTRQIPLKEFKEKYTLNK